MTKSRHYLWQKRWKVDPDTRAAVHECGLVVRFSSPPSTGVKEIGLPANPDEALASLSIKNGGHNAPIMLRRLLREATEVYGSRVHERARLS